jgi:uncharacterized protein
MITKKINKEQQTIVYFTDLDLDLPINPGTGDIIILKNDLAIRRSVRNLVLLNFGEKQFNPSVGSSVRSKLFEPCSPETAGQIKTAIQLVIENFEPRVQLKSVGVFPSNDETGYNVNIEFYLKSAVSTLQQVSLFLQRIR